MSNNTKRLFCFGLGFVASRLADRLKQDGWTVGGTTREVAASGMAGVSVTPFDGIHTTEAVMGELRQASHLVISIPPDEAGDPVIRQLDAALRQATNLQWIGYLSTTGVYGDTGGALVDEDAPLQPTSPRSHHRVTAEQQWLERHSDQELPVHIFRLAGIYGPGRSTLDQVRAGRARRIDFPSRKFARTHVDDIVTVLLASMANPNPGGIYNVCDDESAAQSDVIKYACHLLGIEPPPLIPFDDAYAEMSEMARTFWNDDRRVDNRRIKQDLRVSLAYPTYREGLTAILAEQSTA